MGLPWILAIGPKRECNVHLYIGGLCTVCSPSDLASSYRPILGPIAKIDLHAWKLSSMHAMVPLVCLLILSPVCDDMYSGLRTHLQAKRAPACSAAIVFASCNIIYSIEEDVPFPVPHSDSEKLVQSFLVS